MRTYDTRKPVAPVNRRILSHVFDTLGEMLDACEAPIHECQSTATRARLDSTAQRGDVWTYGELKDGETFMRTLREGWDVAHRVDALAAKIVGNMATPLDLRRKIRRGPMGDDYDIHMARAGKHDRAWTARRKTVARAPAPIRILSGVVFHCGTNAEAFFWKGACALALATALKRKGYRVAISGVGILRDGIQGGTYVARFDALRYGESIDTSRLASSLCSAATLRHVLFRTCQLLPLPASGNFGYPPDGDNELEDNVVASGAFPARNEERLVVPQHIASRDSAAKWVAEVSARFA